MEPCTLIAFAIYGFFVNLTAFVLVVMIVDERRKMYLPTHVSRKAKIVLVVGILIPWSYVAMPVVGTIVASLFSLGKMICDFFFD